MARVARCSSVLRVFGQAVDVADETGQQAVQLFEIFGSPTLQAPFQERQPDAKRRVQLSFAVGAEPNSLRPTINRVGCPLDQAGLV
jgi:hypothetical protein